MAMTLRLSEAEAEALRQQARLEGRSMQDVTRTAVSEYVERNRSRDLVDRALDEVLPRYADALRRLADA